ncbi:Trehalose/maltose import ATP-binding protein MalK [uncultured archaeon]|nr:Trehalose/maltose import ATP-binding protein MalK [uncultured archaeon]
MITQPQILLLDEPFSSLDYTTRVRLRRDLKKIREMIKIPIILITHNPVEAYTMADTLVVYRYGGIEQVGMPKEIFDKPKSEKVARLIGINNIFKGKICSALENEVVIQGQDRIVAPKVHGLETGDEVTWCIQSNQVMVLRDDRPLGKAVQENIFSGKISEIIPKGMSYLLFVEGDFDLEIEMPVHAFERLDLRVGKPIKISLKKSAIHVIKGG